MSDYKIKDKGIQADTEATSAISTISYEVENGLYKGLSKKKIDRQLKAFQKNGKFPKNLQLVDAFYDKKTSLSGVAFKDTTTGKVTVGFAGTNLDNGMIDNVKDIGADGSIAFNGESGGNAYFRSGNAFVQKLQKNYEVGTVTGHSKGGRDGAVIGMQNKVPNIILYNAAPLNSFIGQGISTAINPTGGLSRLWNDGEMFLLVKNYKGRMIYFRSEKDPLTKSATITGSIYPGQTFLLENDKGHAITGFLDKEAQTFISGKLLLVDKNGKVRSGLEVATEMTEMNLKGLNDLRKSFLKAGGGRLSAAQEEFLDASEALALTQGIQQTVQDELAALKKTYQKGIENAKTLWKDTVADAAFHGNALTHSEQLAALESGRATEQTIIRKPVAEYENKLAKLTAQEKKYDTLLASITTAIQETVAKDQELADQLRGF